MDNPKKIIGITGAIGSGKSEVSREFGRLGCAVIDADAIAHTVLKVEKVKNQLKTAFGPEIIDGSGEIDRCIMAGIVFKSKKNVEIVNSIIHPLVLAECEKLIYKYNLCEKTNAIVLDMPLLIEVGWAERCDFVIFIEASEENRADRLGKKGAQVKKNLKNRQKFQISLDNKAEIAHYTVNNNSDLKALSEQVVRVYSIITNK